MHYWSRELTGPGLTVRVMAPIFVTPYLKTNKNDRNDAAAICEAVQRPDMRSVQPRTPEQLAVLHLHHARRLPGLVARQASSGGKARLLRISKRGDRYLRSLLIHGARTVICHIRRRLQAGQPGGNPWVEQLLQRCHPNKVAVALGNKMARIARGKPCLRQPY